MNKPSELPISDADWHETPVAVQALVIAMWERVQRVERLEQRVEQLERQLRRRGGPPSSESGTAPMSGRKSKRRSSGRSRGGQPGHEGHGRSLVPLDHVDEMIPVKPASCRQCRQPLTGDDPHPMRHQVIEVPQVQARVTEYRMHTLRCTHCTTLTEAEWPEGVPRNTFGPSVQAWVGLLSGSYRMSKRNIVSLLHDAFGLELSLGTVSRLEQHVSDVLATPVEDARAYVRQQPAVNIDETSWREGTDKAWLWTAATEEVTTFAIRQSRGSDVAQELLGDNATAVVGSDRFTAYRYLPVANRQLCWAHLQRTFEVFTERGGQAAKIGTVLLEQVDTLFTWWHRIRDGTLEWSSFRTYLSRIRHRIHMELLYGQLLADPQTATTCANLLQVEPAMWTFASKPGVEPTNNAAERALRHGVLWRHTSFGTQCAAGSRFVERMLTVRTTLRQQRRSVLEYLATACQATLHNQPAPSLLP